MPGESCGVRSNAEVLARFAAISQENGLVPIVEPEVLMDGHHSLEHCALATERMLSALYHELIKHSVMLEGTILKPNMITPGSAQTSVSPEEVATMTVRCLQRTVPCAVPAVLFLSGGQSEELATTHLNAINSPNLNLARPWHLSFSFGRALQASMLQAWEGKAENVGKAQDVFLQRCKACGAAQLGEYLSPPPEGISEFA
jgi:fructose-bisphosphate aldolase class I